MSIRSYEQQQQRAQMQGREQHRKRHALSSRGVSTLILFAQGLSPAVVRILRELGFGEVRRAIRRCAEIVEVAFLKPMLFQK